MHIILDLQWSVFFSKYLIVICFLCWFVKNKKKNKKRDKAGNNQKQSKYKDLG